MPGDMIYRKVCDYLKQAIANGEMKLGEAIYSENKLCELLQVSRTSVRHAIREMVAENILESRQGVGTFVKGVMPSLSICLLNHYTRTLRWNAMARYYPDIIFNAEAECVRQNCRFLIFSRPLPEVKGVAAELRLMDAAGFLIDGAFQDSPNQEILQAIEKFNPKCVVVDGNPEETALLSAAPDWEPGFRELLSASGIAGKPVLFVTNSTIARNRWGECCFRRAVGTAGIRAEYLDFSENVPPRFLSMIDQEFVLFPLLEKFFSVRKYRAVFCSRDDIAALVLNFLHRSGLRVPQDVRVAAVGEMQCEEKLQTPLTTLRIFSGELARRSADLLIRRVRQQEVCGNLLLSAQVFYRDSFPEP